MKYLEQENVIMKGGKVDEEKLDHALQSLFGQGAGRIIFRLMVQKSPSRGWPASFSSANNVHVIAGKSAMG